MKCIHGGFQDECSRCRKKLGLPPIIKNVKTDEELNKLDPELGNNNLRMFCKVHKSIWGSGWWCLWACWMESIHAQCEVEYLITV